MRFRSFTVCVVAATLLACPFPCLADAAAGLGPAGLAADRCAGDCCSGASGERSGQSGADDCGSGCGTCLCHGAVTDRPAALPSPHAGIVSFVPLDAMLLAGESSFAEDRPLTVPGACHCPSADSGRKVRALIASLLL